MDRSSQYLTRRSFWIPVWKCSHKEPPPSLLNPNWHHLKLHPWPVHLEHKTTQQYMDFLCMIGSRMLCSRLTEEMLKQQACPSTAATPDEYLRSFIVPSTHRECAARPSALGSRSEMPQTRLLPLERAAWEFQSPRLPKG